MRSSFSGAGSGSCPTLDRTRRWRWRPRANMGITARLAARAAGWCLHARSGRRPRAVAARRTSVAALKLVAQRVRSALNDARFSGQRAAPAEPLRGRSSSTSRAPVLRQVPQRPRVKHLPTNCHASVASKSTPCRRLGNCAARTHRTFLLYLVLQNALLLVERRHAAGARARTSPPEPAAAAAACRASGGLHERPRARRGARAALPADGARRARAPAPSSARASCAERRHGSSLRRDTLNAAAGLPPLVRPFDRGAARDR